MFLRDRYNLPDIPIREIEPQFIEDGYTHLPGKREQAGYFLPAAVTTLKQIVLIARHKGYVQINPFAGFRTMIVFIRQKRNYNPSHYQMNKGDKSQSPSNDIPIPRNDGLKKTRYILEKLIRLSDPV